MVFAEYILAINTVISVDIFRIVTNSINYSHDRRVSLHVYVIERSNKVSVSV